MCRDIEDVRANIDRIDEQIVKLIAERAAYVRKAAEFKKNSTEVKAADRVEQVIRRIRQKAEEYGAPADMTEDVYRTMINGFIDTEMKEFNKNNISGGKNNDQRGNRKNR